jgi:hypothetical protein
MESTFKYNNSIGKSSKRVQSNIPCVLCASYVHPDDQGRVARNYFQLLGDSSYNVFTTF